MKIVQLAAATRNGGMGKHVVELCNALSEQHQVAAICDQSYTDCFSDSVEHFTFDVAAATNWFSLWRLYRLIQRINPDIVHAHGNKASKILSRLKPFISAKTIATIHWELKKNRERRIYSKLNAVIAVNDHLLEKIQNPHCFVINNGVPKAEPTLSAGAIRQQYQLPADAKVAIAIGRMVTSKGFDILIKAWQGVDGYLLLVGDGPIRPALEQLAGELNIADKIIFTGQLDDATALFPAADLVVVSSLHEGFGYVIAEALINRMPLVSTAVAFAQQQLPASLLAPPGDSDALHELLVRAIGDIGHTTALLEESYCWSEKHLSLAAMTEQTADSYRQIAHAEK